MSWLLRAQLVHGRHHGITLTCKYQVQNVSIKPLHAARLDNMIQQHLKAALAWNELHCGGRRNPQASSFS